MKGFGDNKKSKKKIIKNIKPNNLKAQIISKAFTFHAKGDISQAIKQYKYFIDQGFADTQVFSNYGVLLKELGKITEAEIFIRKAIELNPKFAMNHSNLGVILKDLGKLQEAEASFRKAIELNPKFADAYVNLAGVLRDLGKLEEFILISKSIIEIQFFNKGYKLRALTNIAIGNLLLKKFSETILNIKKTNELISQGALDLIQNEKNRKHVSVFSRFISSLYPLLTKNNDNNDLRRIPHFGESHCLSFAHQMLSISSKLNQIQPVLITGAKAWHFATSEMNKWKDSLNKQIKHHRYSDIVFISFGEIDCRKDEGIISFSLKSNKAILEVCDNTINGFLHHIEIILSPHYSQRYYFGIPAPTIKKELPDELDIKRIETIKIYNSLLKEKVLSRGSFFVDVYKLTSSVNGTNNNIHMCDKTHLSPESLSILFDDYLCKP